MILFSRPFEKNTVKIGTQKLLFHQNNAPSQKSTVAIAKLNELGFELVPVSLYFPDLASCDFFLLPNLKV